MDGKKDPGKFTVRFNIADPRQREVVDLLNRQGRFKAQFLANAVQHYVCGKRAPEPKGNAVNSEQLRQLIEEILVQRTGLPEQAPLDPLPVPNRADGGSLDDTERRSIFQTLDAFQQK